MYCFSNHVISTTAGVAVFLVVSLIIFWTSMGGSTDVHNDEEFTSLNNSIIGSVTYQFVEGEKQHINSGVTQQYRSSSTLSVDQYKVSDRRDGAVAKGSKDSNDSTQTKSDDIISANHSDKIEYVTPLKTNKNQYEDPRLKVPEILFDALESLYSRSAQARRDRGIYHISPSCAQSNVVRCSHDDFECPRTARLSSLIADGQSMTKRHYSGNFRQPTASVWDPHPQYEFTAFGREFRLRLKHDSSFLSPDVKVTHIRNNETTREQANHQLGCFYSGYIDGDPKSDVSVSLCHGMTGHVRTSSGSYIIKPAEYWKEERGRTLKHVFYRESKTRSNGSSVSGSDIQPRRNGCGVIDYDAEDEVPVPLVDDSSAGEIYVGDRHRDRRSSTTKIFWDNAIQSESMKNRLDKLIWYKDRRIHSIHESTNTRDTQMGNLDNRRADQSPTAMDPFSGLRSRRAVSQKYFIEIMVVADKKMIEYHRSELLSYILVLMSTVYRIYKDPSIGNPISIAVTKIVQVDQSFGVQRDGTNGISAAEMLKSFCTWQKFNNPNEPSPEHHDAALLLTREILCQDPGQKRCETLGLAQLGGMCSLGSSCAIVQDNGLPTAFTMAHEIGHVLNMPHDDDPKCEKFQVGSDVHNFMTRRLDDSSFRWEWSKCSRHYITEFLENANCLLDEPNNLFITSDAIRLPGEDYSGNNQCELVFGRGSKICTHRVDDVCKRLWCMTPEDVDCRTLNMPWADGTPCGNDQSELKWCHRGECVSVENLKPIHGQWGEWGEYGECSRTCGGGIQKRYRECNGPSPKNGGDYCIGERVEDRSCATNECSLDALDFREEQCSKFNNNNMKIEGLDNNTEWHAKYSRLVPEDRCKLFCQVESKQYYMLRDKVIDGTPCGPDTFDICVHGHCKPAGCDHILNSTAKLDTCGVCRGDNSTCQKITGSHNSSHYGYTRVIKIPAGSSNIDIRQYGWSSSQNDSNYLALRLGEGGEYILNGNYTIMHRKVIIHPGITIEYSGPDTLVERLNTSRTINVNIILEVLSVEKVLPQIVYEYTVPKNILKNYKWSLSDWSECNYVCQGMKYRRAQCQSTEFKETVSEDYCTPEEKPQEERQTCNSYCTLEWQVAEVSECSNYCGPGNRTISTQCVQTLKNHEGQPSEPVAMHACWHIKRPSNYEPCIGPCNSAHWSYGKWGTCSVTCGDGIQSRTATCVDTSDKVVAETKCITEEKIVTRICGDKICPQWSFGKWSACSVTCGIGERIRSIWCHIENRIVDTKLCTNSTLDAKEMCDAGPCYRWDTSHFKNCDIECRERRFRKIRCKDMEGNLVADVHCYPQKKPKQLKKCHRETCATSITASETPRLRDGGKRRWRVSNWTPCSKHCGVGVQERIVTCRRVNGFGWVDPLPIDGCTHDKRPNKKRNCKLRECNDEYYWTTGKWRKCSHSCGRKGKQTRRLFCVDANGEKHARFYCPSKFKPNRERKCNQRRCGPRTCLEAQKRYKPMNDGEYVLLIGGKSMKIFCLDAASSSPREYLTLPAGDRKNYAEIYNKRLLNPNQCPFNGRRNDTCECISDAEGISGITYFQRVRINPTTLTIIVDDFTFSQTKGAKRVEFGKAGDCYSNATNCPQGSFNIDLTGTLLRISSDVSWVPTKSRAFLAVKRVNEQRISGKCGGYCGFCTPKSGIKLDVLRL